MSYEIVLSIHEDSPAGRNIETLAEAEHVSREEAALKLLASSEPGRARPAGASARRIIGAFKQDATVMDDALEIAMNDRQHRNSTPPHG